jgi:tetratricopeptide (TPR) repeat protein
MTPRRRLRRAIAAALLVATATVAARPMLSDAHQVPVDRLAANLEALIAKEPANVSLRLNLARLYAMAYALKTDTVPVRPDREADGVDFGFGNNGAVPFKNKSDASPASLRAAQGQLTKALAAYRNTLTLAPGNLVANLGYAWCLSQASDKAAAIRAYRTTITLAWEVEQKPRSAMVGDQSITEEAATYLIPLLDPVADRDEIAKLRERIVLIDKADPALDHADRHPASTERDRR